MNQELLLSVASVLGCSSEVEALKCRLYEYVKGRMSSTDALFASDADEVWTLFERYCSGCVRAIHLDRFAVFVMLSHEASGKMKYYRGSLFVIFEGEGQYDPSRLIVDSSRDGEPLEAFLNPIQNLAEEMPNVPEGIARALTTEAACLFLLKFYGIQDEDIDSSSNQLQNYVLDKDSRDAVWLEFKRILRSEWNGGDLTVEEKALLLFELANKKLEGSPFLSILSERVAKSKQYQ